MWFPWFNPEMKLMLCQREGMRDQSFLKSCFQVTEYICTWTQQLKAESCSSQMTGEKFVPTNRNKEKH